MTPTVGPPCLWCWYTSSLLLGLWIPEWVSFILDTLVVKALALSTRDHTCNSPLFFGSLRVLLVTFGILPFHMKDCTLFSVLCNAGSHTGIMPAWYQTSERHMILATITLSNKVGNSSH
jgi:hypothetical protein